MGNLALYYAEKGDIRNGQIIIGRARQIADNVDLTYYNAEIEYLAGRKKEAAAALQDALKKGYSLEIAKADPWFTNAFQEPEFQAILDRLHLRSSLSEFASPSFIRKESSSLVERRTEELMTFR